MVEMRTLIPSARAGKTARSSLVTFGIKGLLNGPSEKHALMKLRQSGARINHMTLARWRSQGWRPLHQEPRHPLEAARDHLDDAVPVLTATQCAPQRASSRGAADRELSPERSRNFERINAKTANRVAFGVSALSLRRQPQSLDGECAPPRKGQYLRTRAIHHARPHHGGVRHRADTKGLPCRRRRHDHAGQSRQARFVPSMPARPASLPFCPRGLAARGPCRYNL
jgi:hypothetical protein